MTSYPTGLIPEGFHRGAFQGTNLIGEITESIQRFLLDGWSEEGRLPPRVEENLSQVPKDREELIYTYMYRVAQNTALMNSKHWRPAKISLKNKANAEIIYYERPPIYLDLYYMVMVHSKFRSDAERLMGWVLLRLHEANQLIYRPRRYLLPNGKEVDSNGNIWQIDNDSDGLIMEKVSIALVDDLSLGDAINFMTIHEAPYRPYLTYRARCAMEGSLVSAPPTTVRMQRTAQTMSDPPPAHQRPGGRLAEVAPVRKKPVQVGPEGFGHKPIEETTDNEE
jgi:hypothetical protein